MFNPFGQPQTYDDIERRRQAGYGLMQGGSQAGSPLGALASIFGGLMSRNADKHQTRMAADEKTAEIEKRAQFGQRLLSGMGDNPEMKLVADLLNSGIPEYQQMGVERALSASQTKAPQGIAATEFLTQYGDKFDGTPEQFATMAEDGIVTGQELAGLKRKQDPKAQLELEKIQAQIAKEKALTAKAGRAPQGQQLTPMQQAMANMSPEDLAKAARIQMGLDPRAVAGKPTPGGTSAAAQISANSADTTLAALEEMLTGGQINTGPIMGRVGSAIPTSERQQFDSLVAQLAPEIKKLQRSAGEGAFSDADLRLLLSSMPNATTDEAANLNIIKQLRAKVGALGGALGVPANASEDDALINKYRQ